jgi:hypothetical protein
MAHILFLVAGLDDNFQNMKRRMLIFSKIPIPTMEVTIDVPP